MANQRKPQTITELARAVHYAILEARAALGPVATEQDNFAAHCILANTPIISLVAAIEDIPLRELVGEPGFDTIRVDGWMLDWWPEYPDWVFDKEEHGDSTS